MVDFQKIIDYFYGEGSSELKRLLLLHSRAVADKALQICDRHPELGLDRDFVEAAAMLHDVGIIRCDAPRIYCHGTEPYIRHGILGAEMLSSYLKEFPAENPPVENPSVENPSSLLEKISRVCQRHTGAGITRQEVLDQQLPLPLPDDDSEPYMPETVAEKLICYADKFFSKTRPDHEKTLEEAERSLAKFGESGVGRFRAWAQLFDTRS